MIQNLAKRLFDDINRLVDEKEGLVPSASEIKTLIESKLSQLDLVTREDFEAQKAVLLRTREKLEALEKQLNQLLADQSKS